jgi:rare lipoprotein A
LQTKLRNISLLFAASLLWVSSASALSARAITQKAVAAHKVRSIGIASWYGKQHQGRKMANGQRFDRHKLTAASWYLPMGTMIRVFNLKNGKSVVVTVTDRGPNLRLHRILDLSEAAATQLDYVAHGLTPIFFMPLNSLVPEDAAFSDVLVEPAAADLVATDGRPDLPAPPQVLAMMR